MLLLSFTVVETAEVISHEVFRETVLIRRDLSATQPTPKKNFDTCWIPWYPNNKFTLELVIRRAKTQGVSQVVLCEDALLVAEGLYRPSARLVVLLRKQCSHTTMNRGSSFVSWRRGVITLQEEC